MKVGLPGDEDGHWFDLDTQYHEFSLYLLERSIHYWIEEQVDEAL